MDAAKAGVSEYQALMDGAAEGSAEHAEAQIGLETYQEIVKALE